MGVSILLLWTVLMKGGQIKFAADTKIRFNPSSLDCTYESKRRRNGYS